MTYKAKEVKYTIMNYMKILTENNSLKSVSFISVKIIFQKAHSCFFEITIKTQIDKVNYHFNIFQKKLVPQHKYFSPWKCLKKSEEEKWCNLLNPNIYLYLSENKYATLIKVTGKICECTFKLFQFSTKNLMG